MLHFQSMSVESEEMLLANFSDLLLGNKSRELNGKPRSVYWFLIRNAVKRHGPRCREKTLLHEYGLTL